MDHPVPGPRAPRPDGASGSAPPGAAGLAAALTGVLADHAALTRTARTGAEHRSGWAALAATGLFRALLPSARGGLGLDETALVPLLEAVGRSGLPCPVTTTAAVAAPLLGYDPGDGMVTADLGGHLLPCAADAAVFLLRHDSGLHLLDAEDVLVRCDDASDLGRHAPAMADFLPSAETLLTDDPEIIDAAFDRGALGTAAELLGVTGRLLDLLDRPGQAREALERARAAVLRAAYSLAARDGASREVSLAKATANDTARAVARLIGEQRTGLSGAAGKPSGDAPSADVASPMPEAAPFGVSRSAAGRASGAEIGGLLERLWTLTRAYGDTLFHRSRFDRSVLTDPGSLLF